MESPQISVIIPVYNAENTLRRCIDSLLAQTFIDFEILLIDDGSSDYSGEICDTYTEIDNRVKVFHKENGGVSSARELGLQSSKGEYIIHVDPDDWVDSTFLSRLYETAIIQNADMVICDFFDEYKDARQYSDQRPSSFDHGVVLREIFRRIHGSCCNKLIKHEVIRKYGAHFPYKLNIGEDLYFISMLLIHDIKIEHIPHALYHYDHTSNSNSIVNKRRKWSEVYMQQVSIFEPLFKIDYPDILDERKYCAKQEYFLHEECKYKYFLYLFPEINCRIMKVGRNYKYNMLIALATKNVLTFRCAVCIWRIILLKNKIKNIFKWLTNRYSPCSSK